MSAAESGPADLAVGFYISVSLVGYVSPQVLVSLLLRCVEKTRKACCCETVTDTVEQRARVKIPLSLPDICIGNHKSVAQNHVGFPRALRGSNSTGKKKVCVSMCACVCVTCMRLPALHAYGFCFLGFFFKGFICFHLSVTECLVDFTARNHKGR